MTAPPPIAHVNAEMHGGPRHGDIMFLAWAPPKLELPVWDDDDLTVDDLLASDTAVYKLRNPGLWRGQSTADYDYVPVAVPLPEDEPISWASLVRLAAAGVALLLISWSLRP